MAGWWDSIGAVSKFNNWMQIAIVVFGVLTAAATAMRIVASNRMASLQSAETAILQERLRGAETSSAQIREELKTTTEKLTAAETAIHTATSQASEARAVAEQSKSALQPRAIGSDRRRAMLSVLRGGPAGHVDIAAILGDAESIAFANELDVVLREGGWTTSGVSQAVYTPIAPTGIFLKVRSKEAVPGHAAILQKALAAAGIEAPGIFDGQVDPSFLGLVVGHK